MLRHLLNKADDHVLRFSETFPDPVKLLSIWMEWEEGEIEPGRLISNLKTAGMPELLEQLVAAAQAPSQA